MRGNVLEAGDLLVLRRQVVDRVEDEVRERERPVHSRGGEVADRDGNIGAAGLLPQLRHHLAREIDAVYLDAALPQRQCYAAGADAELERGTEVVRHSGRLRATARSTPVVT